jgi:UMF1 family MFS transporter
VAANLVAGVATIGFGFLDDRIGPKRVIVGSLVSMLIFGAGVFFFHDGGAKAFWVFGLLLCIFVGPAQSASRTFLARLIPAGREGEVFGLYATTGRAVSFMAPMLWSVFISIGAALTQASKRSEAEYFGILGIMVVLLVGLVLLLPVRDVARGAGDRQPAPPSP